jgi:ABC-2 type transport system permease protein
LKKIIRILKREFLTKVFTKGFIIATVLGPILMIGIMLAPAYFMTMTTEKSLLIGIVEETGDFSVKLQEIYPDTLSSGELRLNFFPIAPQEYQEMAESYKSKIEAGNYHALLVIPPNVYDSITVTYLAKTVSDIDLIQQLRNGLSNIINNERLQRAGLNPAEIKNLMRQVNIQTIKIQKGEEQAREFGQEYLTALIFLLILYMTIILYGSSVMRSVIEEKSSRIIEVLLSSINSFQLMMGKLIGVGAVGLLQYVIWAGMGFVVFLLVSSSSPPMAEFIKISPDIFFYFIIFFIVGFFTFSTLYAAVGAMCSDMQDAQALSAPITLLVILPFIISFMVIRDPTSEAAQILSFLPFFTPLIMFLRILLIDPPSWEILLSLLINILTIILITWVAGKIYRVGILMYGKRPTLPEIIRWIRIG